MATKSIADLTAATTLAGSEVVPIVQGGATVKATTQAIANLRAVPVTSVAGRTGAVTLTKTDVGLANVNNTTDASKPISTATQTALDGKLAASGGTISGNLSVLGTAGIGTTSTTNTFEVYADQNANTTIQITNPNAGGGAAAVLSIQSTSASKNFDITVTDTSCGLSVGSGFGEFSVNVPSIKTYIGGFNAFGVTAEKNIHGIAGTQAMTSGFFYIPKASGQPSGTPTAITGCAPMYFDSTANRFYIHNGTAWKSVLLA